MEEIPVRYQRHIFVCVNERENEECCAKRDSLSILHTLRDYINANGLTGQFNVTKTKCLGHCSEGPTIAVYPDGKMFKRVLKKDVKEIIERFLK